MLLFYIHKIAVQSKRQYWFLLLAFIFLSTPDVIAQSDEKKEKVALTSTSKKGEDSTASDAIFSTNFRFRMQNRFTVMQEENTTYETKIRHLRLSAAGHVLKQNLTYKIQLSLAPDDLKHGQQGERIPIIKDLTLQYQPSKNWKILFGYKKLPGNRQSVNSSSSLQLTDRSINNKRFNINRDLGLQVTYNQLSDKKFSYAIITALSTGKSLFKIDNGENSYALTGKLELYPLGSFTDGGSSYEGDLVREPSPKLMVSGAFHHNGKAQLSEGVHGSYLYETRDLQSTFIDMLFKYRGWSAMFAYLDRTTNNPITISDADPNLQSFVYTGHGFDYQLSYLLPKDYEIIGRFSNQKVEDELFQLNLPHTKEWTIGLTKYIWKHKVKWQLEWTYQEETYSVNPIKDSWYLRTQIEFGI